MIESQAKEPGQRFATVEDFALALEEACQVTQPLSLRWGAAQQSTEQDTPPAPAMPPVLLTPPRPTNGHHLLPPRPTLHQQTDSKVGKPTLAQSNRQRFLKRVRAFWIEGVLEHSLHGAALIALGLQEQRDALANPWHLVVQHSDTLPRPFPVGTCITEVYDAANGELLILGAPGAGKTTLLLELARHLLDRAEQDEQQPMPIVFPLSSWATRQQPLGEWMIEELIGKYQVPQQLARTWVETDQILPLLDGLDEVAAENRTTCIEAINTYQQQHAFLPLVVSSRSADYLAQTARVKLTSAVTIQPLTQQQVDEYLAQAGEPLWALRVALHQDTALRELAETPLMLSILTLTYHGMPVEELLRGGIAPTRQQVFERYTERMLSRRGTIPSYSPQQTKGWLSWLARQMQRQGQTVFYLERLQPDWLSSSRLLRAYHRWAIRLPGVLIGILLSLAITGLGSGTVIMTALLAGLLGGLLSGGGAAPQPEPHGRKTRRISWQQILQWLLVSLLIGLGSGLSSELSSGVIGKLREGVIYGLASLLLQILLVKRNTAQRPFQTSPPIGRTKWQRLTRNTVLRYGLLIGVVVGLIFGLNYGLSDRLIFGLSYGLIFGLGYGFIGGLLSHLLIDRSVSVQLTERVILSWKSLGRSLWSSQNRRAALQIMALVGLIYGLGNGLHAGLVSGLHAGLSIGLINGLSIGLIYWFLSGFFQGVASETIEDQQRVVPNQGIHRSARNGVVLGVVSTMIVGLSIVLSSGLSIGLGLVLSGELNHVPSHTLGLLLSSGLSTGLSAGLLFGLLMGGWACLRHYVLRLLLWRAGAMPWNYPRFLDYAAEHILLRKVGGGYIFVHRLLLEYFASLDTPPTPD